MIMFNLSDSVETRIAMIPQLDNLYDVPPAGAPVSVPDVDGLVAAYQWAAAGGDGEASWQQGWWGSRWPRCGTSYCLAGYRCAIEPNVTILWDVTQANSVEISGKRRPISNVAAELFGLTAGQARVLFAADNKLEDVRAIIEHITGVDPAKVGE